MQVVPDECRVHPPAAGLKKALFLRKTALFPWLLLLPTVDHGGDLSRDAVVLAVPSKFPASYVETHLKDRLLAALRTHDPSLRDVRVIV